MNTQYETQRLSLRILDDTHGGMVTDFYNRNFEEFSKYEPLSDRARTLTYHKKNLEYEYNLFLKGQFFRFFIFEKYNPMTIIGTISYREIQRDFYESCIIGYKMDRFKRRMGYCREAIDFADGLIFNDLKLNRIEATIKPDNVPSMNLLSSLGYVNEGLLREKIKINEIFTDHYLFAIIKRDYIALHQ